MKTSKKGISLIVLVITIVVMIILAAAIILSLRSEGIIGRANEAKISTDASNAKDLVAVASSEWTAEKDEIMENEGVSTFKEYAEKRLRESGYKITTTTDDKEGSVEVLADGTVYMYPVIPEGFVASDLPKEDQVSEGLVIYEGNGNPSEASSSVGTRNQFVWVPVNSMGDFILKDGYANGKLSTYYVTDGRVDEPYGGLIADETGEIAEYKAMKKSVEKYGGFYIARYEAGKETIDGVDTVVSRKRATVWTNIPWGTSKTEVGTEGAVAMSRGMYAENDSFVSHLIYGVQWDAALAFISKTDPNYIKDGTNSGNYGSLKTCGANVTYAKNNIYDMAGNVFEWTMTSYKGSISSRIYRGGYWNTTGLNSPSSSYGSFDASMGFEARGFRVALYLK